MGYCGKISLSAFLYLLLGNLIQAQILEQNFETLNNITEFRKLPSDLGTVDAVYATQNEYPSFWSLELVGGTTVLQFIENSTYRYNTGQWTKAHEPTKFVHLQLDLSLIQDLPADGIFLNDAAGSFYFYYGDASENLNSPLAPDRLNRIAEFEVFYQADNGLKIRNTLRNASGNVLGSSIITSTFVGDQRINIYLNTSNLDEAYVDPLGNVQLLSAKVVDLWIGNLLIMDGVGFQDNTTNPITRLRFSSRNNTASGRIRFDNIVYESLEGVGVPLPVSWGRFSATLKINSCALFWETISEENNQFFIVERSVDGLTFDSLAVVSGAGTSNEVQQYEYQDSKLPLATKDFLYYRLKQVDLDGRSSYSQLVPVDRNQIPGKVLVYPNPFSKNLSIYFGPNHPISSTIEFSLYNIFGLCVWKEVRKPEPNVQLAVENLLPGVYFLEIRKSNQSELYRLLKTD